jgi:Reverse transcriptase (RNA-dependent DNA polymerase)
VSVDDGDTKLSAIAMTPSFQQAFKSDALKYQVISPSALTTLCLLRQESKSKSSLRSFHQASHLLFATRLLFATNFFQSQQRQASTKFHCFHRSVLPQVIESLDSISRFSIWRLSSFFTCYLKLHQNVYSQKQARRVWNQYLVNKLVHEVGFKQSKVDECVFYHGNVLYALYTDDSLLAGPSKKEIDQAMEDIKAANLKIEIEGDIKDFLGVNIEQSNDGSITFTQPHLIDKVLNATRIHDISKIKHTPAGVSQILHRHSNSEPFDNSFNYRSVLGMLYYLDKGTRSDIAYATHQCARFCEQPKKEHGKAVRWIARYLLGTKDKGMTFKPDLSKGLEEFVDSDFAGNWDKSESKDRDTARS